MIKDLSSYGKYIQVIGGIPAYTPSSNYYGTMGQGNLRYNMSTQNLEVCDGMNWVVISSSPAVTLTREADELLDWAKRKRDEEIHLDQLAKSHPTIASLVDELNLTKDKIAVVAALIRKENNIV